MYDWKDKEGKQPLDSYEYSYQAKIIDNGGDMVTSPDYKIPVLQVRREKTKIDSSAGKQIEKISLVLFEFNKFDLGKRNDLIMSEFVFPRLYDSVYVIVNGYTDIIGQDEANLKLSINRARAVSEIVFDKVAKDHLFYEGLERRSLCMIMLFRKADFITEPYSCSYRILCRKLRRRKTRIKLNNR